MNLSILRKNNLSFLVDSKFCIFHESLNFKIYDVIIIDITAD